MSFPLRATDGEDIENGEPVSKEEDDEDNSAIPIKLVKIGTKPFVEVTLGSNGEKRKITLYRIFKEIRDKLGDRPFTILDKENKELCKQAIRNFVTQCKTSIVLHKMVKENQSYHQQLSLAEEYAKTIALSELFLTSVQIEEEDKDKTSKALALQEESSLIITYVLLNSKEQADAVTSFVALSISKDRSIRENFIEVSSQYTKPKVSSQNYPRSENYLISLFGNEIMESIKETPEGQCSKKPIYLSKSKKWILFHVDKREKKFYQDSEIAYYALLQKTQEIINTKVSEMQKIGEIQLINPRFYEDLDSNSDMSKVLIRVGGKKITVGDLKRTIEILHPEVNADTLLAKYKKQKNPEYGKQFCMQALNFAVKLVIQSILAEEYEFDKENQSIYEESLSIYKDKEFKKLLELLLKNNINNEDLAKEFKLVLADPEKKEVFSDTLKFRGMYLGVEGKDILDRLKLRISHAQDRESLEQLMKQLVMDYSIYPITDDKDVSQYRFDDRRYKINKMLGDFYELSTGSKVEEVKPDSFYFTTSADKELYHLVYVKDTYKEDITLDEKSEELKTRILKKLLDSLFDEVTVVLKYE